MRSTGHQLPARRRTCTRRSTRRSTARPGCGRRPDRRWSSRTPLTEITGPALGERDLGPLRRRPDPPARRRAARRADHRARPGARRRRPAGAAHAGRGVAGQRRRPVPARPATATRRRSTRTSPAPAAASPTPRAATGSSRSSPGAYPWRNHHNAWRPAHIHFSLFGRAFVQRLVTQMYFPGDPLFGQDPIFNSVRDPAARRADDRPRSTSTPPSRSGRWATGSTSCCAAARRPRSRTDEDEDHDADAGLDPVADRRAVLRASGCPGRRPVRGRRRTRPARSGCAARVIDGAGDPVPDALIETWQTDPRRGDGFRGFTRAPDRRGRPLRAAHAEAGRRCPGPDGDRPRHRTWSCRCSPAACSTGW